jgi:hypothetical protein
MGKDFEDPCPWWDVGLGRIPAKELILAAIQSLLLTPLY